MIHYNDDKPGGIDDAPPEPPTSPDPNGRALNIFLDTVYIIDPTLLAYRARIAELREIRCDLTASIMRDELLCQLEQWIKLAGFDKRKSRRAATFGIMQARRRGQTP